MDNQLSEATALQVEVCIQDCFHPSSSTDLAVEATQSPADNSGASQPGADLSIDGSISEEVWEQRFHQWLELLKTDLPSAPAYELSLRLTDDLEIQSLNAQYRHKDQPTDVLAFAALEVDCPQLDMLEASLPLYLGDIVISVETASKQAKQQQHSLQTELTWLAVHGLLHLLGWDHPDDTSLSRMLNQQQMLLQAIGLTVNLVGTP